MSLIYQQNLWTKSIKFKDGQVVDMVTDSIKSYAFKKINQTLALLQEK